jgi:CubicO group peptidase (beta-lactamase class C family)
MHVKHAALAAGLLVASVLVAASLWRLAHPTTPTRTLGEELQRIVSDAVNDDPSVRNCVLAVTNGDASIVWSGAAGLAGEAGRVPMTKDTSIYIASVTKLYTAAAAMLLVERGVLSLDDPMAKFLPHALIEGIHVYEGKDYSGAITVGELLSHRSGIADYYSQKSADGKSLFDLLTEDPDRSWTVDETIVRAREQMKANFPPGSDTSYSDTNFQLLGKVIEAATGKSLDAAYEDLLFRPFGLERTWLIGHPGSLPAPPAVVADVFRGDANITKTRSNGAYWADGGIVSTAEDMIVFLKALKEGRIVRRETLELMHHWHRMRFPLQYGYGTMYFVLPWPIATLTGLPPLWGHSGSTGSFLYYSEDLDLYVAGTIDQTEARAKPFVLMSRVFSAVKAWERARAAHEKRDDLREHRTRSWRREADVRSAGGGFL